MTDVCMYKRKYTDISKDVLEQRARPKKVGLFYFKENNYSVPCPFSQFLRHWKLISNPMNLTCVKIAPSVRISQKL